MGAPCAFSWPLSSAIPLMQHRMRAMALLRLHRFAPASSAPRLFTSVPQSNHGTAAGPSGKQEALARPLLRSELDSPRDRRAYASAADLRQDRISSTGDFISSSLPASQQAAQWQAPFIGVPDTAPHVAPISDLQLNALAEFLLNNRNVTVLTGAGASTESNIPDYRGPRGAYSTGFKPMTHQQFMKSEASRSRYWARNYAGWHEFSKVEPNATHESLARLQARGWLGPLLTQNVDRLHHRAGSRDVTELHGTTHRVICMSCEEITERESLQEELAALNPDVARAVALMPRAGQSAASRKSASRADSADSAPGAPPGGPEALLTRPDGDVELNPELMGGFRVPPCRSCGGLLKPHVVFFGDGVPLDRATRAMDAAKSCDGLLVVGSSLMVYSAFRLAKAAVASGAELALVSVGPTRADDLAHLKVEALAGEVMARLASHPALLIPRL